jgi:VanZ family protein
MPGDLPVKSKTPTAAALLDPWLAPVVLMAVIFLFSAQPDLGTGLGTLDLILRKIVHMLEYALLTFLWWRALRTRLSATTAAALAFALAVGYAATDEFHQSFVEGRHGTPVDVGIDAVGAGAAALVLRRRETRARA